MSYCVPSVYFSSRAQKQKQEETGGEELEGGGGTYILNLLNQGGG